MTSQSKIAQFNWECIGRFRVAQSASEVFNPTDFALDITKYTLASALTAVGSVSLMAVGVAITPDSSGQGFPSL